MFKDAFRQLQRGNLLEKLVFMEGCYLLNIDGTGYFSSDSTITEDNVYHFMRGARARWKIEDETFNTLKNKGYHLEHNYGLGKKHLSEIFVMLMMLAFLVDQIQQMCCPLFRAVWQKCKSKRSLWEKVRARFTQFSIESMEDLYRSLLEWKLVPLRQ